VAAPGADADIADESALAERYAPVVRLVEQKEECGYGEPYEPLDVDRLFAQPTVALRGPWAARDLIRVGPTAADLARGLYEYHLDFPGNPLEPGCGYERWSKRLAAGSRPTIYAHVATDPSVPGKLALQYWFFYVFNDFNNKHEGDWEMIQLVFAAPDAAVALNDEPLEVGYSQHEGAERASWGDEKLEVVDGTHPVVHPAAGSHANHFEEALYLGSSAKEGVGCDDTSSPTVELRPVVKTIPSDAAAAGRAFPWISFEGRWGELERAFYNGPTGPNLKGTWTEPLVAAEDWRDRSYAVPAGGLLGTSATDFFCTAVQAGSDALRRTIDDPAPRLFVLGALVALALFVLTPYGVAAERASPRHAPPGLGADARGRGADVRHALAALRRDRACLRPDQPPQQRPPGPRLRDRGRRRHRHRRPERWGPGAVRAHHRSNADARRPRARAGRQPRWRWRTSMPGGGSIPCARIAVRSCGSRRCSVRSRSSPWSSLWSA
jgi:hypothetical protein